MGFCFGPSDSHVLSRDAVITLGERLDFFFFFGELKGFGGNLSGIMGIGTTWKKGALKRIKAGGVFQRRRGLWEKGSRVGES